MHAVQPMTPQEFLLKSHGSPDLLFNVQQGHDSGQWQQLHV